MVIVDNKCPKDIWPKDIWSDWSPQWSGARITPHDVQEKHSPTQPVAVHLAPEEKIGVSQRRIVDARLWESMTFMQQDAAREIVAAFEMMGRGMGYVTSNWERIPGCSNPSNVAEAHGCMINLYIAWAEKCAQRKISHAMVADVLCFGFACRMIDHDRRLKNGSTRDNLMRGLSLYCELRGWG